MEEGLVDATVVAGVLSPKGKASPQDEPLFKIQKAAEAFGEMRSAITHTLQVMRTCIRLCAVHGRFYRKESLGFHVTWDSRFLGVVELANVPSP